MVLVNLSLSSVRDRGSELRWFNWLCRTLTGSSPPPKQCNLIWIFHQVQMGLLPTWSEDVLLSKVTWTTRGRSFSCRCESRVAWKNHLLSLLVLPNQKYSCVCTHLHHIKIQSDRRKYGQKPHTHAHTHRVLQLLCQFARENPFLGCITFDGLLNIVNEVEETMNFFVLVANKYQLLFYMSLILMSLKSVIHDISISHSLSMSQRENICVCYPKVLMEKRK